MSELQEKVNLARELANSLQEVLKTLNMQGADVEFIIGTKQKVVSFNMKSSDIPIIEFELKVNINQQL